MFFQTDLNMDLFAYVKKKKHQVQKIQLKKSIKKHQKKLTATFDVKN